MVTKSRKTATSEKKGRVKVGNLHLNKETVTDLSASQQRQIQGGRPRRTMPGAEFECGTYLYPGGPCGVYTQLDCV